MSDDRSFDNVIHALHEALGKVECLLPELGPDLRFQIGPQGEVEIVRRGKKGETLQPKIVVAELLGCDPMLWRPEYPSWIGVLDQRVPVGSPEGSGQPVDGDGGSEPPASN